MNRNGKLEAGFPRALSAIAILAGGALLLFIHSAAPAETGRSLSVHRPAPVTEEISRGVREMAARSGIELADVRVEAIGPIPRGAVRDTLLAHLGFLYAPDPGQVSVVPLTAVAGLLTFHMSEDRTPVQTAETAAAEGTALYRVIWVLQDGTELLAYAVESQDGGYMFDTLASFPPITGPLFERAHL